MSTLADVLKDQPKYRVKQIYAAWFDAHIKDWEDITTLPVSLRKQLSEVAFLSVVMLAMKTSQTESTEKALLGLVDGEKIETVLMGRQNKKDNPQTTERFTTCISTQVGCPMRCAFCETGKCGFTRNLDEREIVDQVRFWFYRLARAHEHLSNIVLMGQGEPLQNYDNVKRALTIIVASGVVGSSKITLSTAGVRQGMERMVAEEDFPPVRFALSLHSAVDETRQRLMPTHTPDFFPFLISWSKRYHARFSSRSHFIGLEYTLLDGINDNDLHLRALVKLAAKLGKVRINLIPFNVSPGAEFTSSSPETIKHWHDSLMRHGFTATVRHSQGQDIAAACGQLRNLYL